MRATDLRFLEVNKINDIPDFLPVHKKRQSISGSVKKVIKGIFSVFFRVEILELTFAYELTTLPSRILRPCLISLYLECLLIVHVKELSEAKWYSRHSSLAP